MSSNSPKEVAQEVVSISPANKPLKRLRHNLEELSALLDSNYKIYLNPKIISRMKELLKTGAISMKASVIMLGMLSLFFSGCMSSSINKKAETTPSFSSYDYFNVVHKSAIKRQNNTANKDSLKRKQRIENMMAWIDLSRE